MPLSGQQRHRRIARLTDVVDAAEVNVNEIGSPCDGGGQAGKDERRSPFSRKLIVTAAFVGIVAAALLFLIWRMDPDPKEDAFYFEAAKVVMQVIGVVLLGALLSYAVSALTMQHQDSLATKAQAHTSDEAELEREHRKSERDVAIAQDAQRRLDEARRDFLDRTITNYNAVKRARRQLRASGYGGATPHHVTADVAQAAFVKQLDVIIEAQLEFERLWKTASLVEASLLDDDATDERLEELYQRCAEYLKDVYRDFEQSGKVPDPGAVTPGLSEFLALRHSQQGTFDQFAESAREAMDGLRNKLAKPIVLRARPGGPR